MFCKKCGKPTEGEATLCPQCAAAEQVQPETIQQPVPEQAPAMEDVLNTAPVPAEDDAAPITAEDDAAPATGEADAGEEEPFTLGAVEAEEPKKGRGLRLFLLLGGVAAVLAIAVALIFLLQKEPQEELNEIQLAALEEIAGDLDNAYGQAMQQFDEQYEPANVHLDMELTAGETVMEALGQQAGMDLSWLKSIGVSSEYYVQGDREQTISQVLLNGVELLTTESILDGWQEYVRTPASDGYVKLYDQEMIDALGELEDIEEIIRNIPLPESDLPADLLRRYGTIVVNGIEEVTAEDKAVTLNGREEDMTVYTAYLRAPQAVKIAKYIRDELYGDTRLEGWLDEVSEYVNGVNAENGSNAKKVDLYGELLNFFDEEIGPEVWEEKVAQAQTNPNYIKLVYYVNDDDEIVGLELSVYDEGQTQDVLSFLAVEEDDITAFRLEADKVNISGERTEVEEKTNCDVTVTVDGQEIVLVSLRDAYTDNGISSGTIRITLGDAVMQELDLGAISLVSPVVEIAYTRQSEKITAHATVSTLGNELLTLKIEATKLPKKDIEVPTDAQEYTDYLLEYYTGGGAEAYFQALSKKMLDAGIPEQLVMALYAEMSSLLSIIGRLG